MGFRSILCGSEQWGPLVRRGNLAFREGSLEIARHGVLQATAGWTTFGWRVCFVHQRRKSAEN